MKVNFGERTNTMIIFLAVCFAFATVLAYMDFADNVLLDEAKEETTIRWSYGQHQNIVDLNRNVMVAKVYVDRYGAILDKMSVPDGLDIDSAITDPRIALGNVYQFTGIVTSAAKAEEKNDDEKSGESAKIKQTLDITVLVDNEHYIVCTAVPVKKYCGFFFLPRDNVGDMVTITGFVVGRGSFADGQRYLAMVGISEKKS